MLVFKKYTNLLFSPTILAFFLLANEVTSKSPNSSEWKCTSGEKEKMDRLIAQVMTYNWVGRNFPANARELKPYCRETMSLLGRADDYKATCLSGEPKTFVSLFLYSVRQSFNSYCRHPTAPKTMSFYGSAGCFNSATRSFNSCRRIYSDILEAIETTKVERKEKLPQLCCGYFKSLECIRGKLSTKKGCNEGDGEVMTDYLNGVYEDAINAMCRDYTEESDKCDAVKLLTASRRNSAATTPKPSHFNQAVSVFTNL